MEENNEVMEVTMQATSIEGGNIRSFDSLKNKSNTVCEIYTNIQDKKELFNLENRIDCLLNDCENEKIRVKGVLIKIYTKPLDEPIIDETTGEVIKDTERTMSCVLVDENGKSYATGSKMFSVQLMKFIQNWGLNDFEHGLDIKIIKKKMTNSNNKALAFELI